MLHRIRTTEHGVLVKPTMSFDEKGHRENRRTYYVLGASGSGTAPKAFYPTVELLIGEGGSFLHPRAVYEASEGVPAGTEIGGREAVGGIVFPKAALEAGETAEYIQNLFMCETFRVYISPDILGMELGGSLKNVVALAAGIADGLGYGDNTKAALITRGITEIARLGTAMGGKYETFGGLTGIGDLIVTCASMHSRNRRAGILIGQGKTYEEAMGEVKMVVEGVYSAKAAMKLARKYDIQIPIIEKVNEVLFGGKSADQAVKELMLRDKKLEVSDLPWPEG